MRVLLDTNIFISYLLSPQRESAINTIVRAAVSQRFVLLLPEALAQELVQTGRNKAYLAERIPVDTLDKFMAILAQVAEPIPRITEAIPAVTRDPKDDYLLAYAMVGQADYLVTGDDDLLSLSQIETIKIVTARTFLEVLSEILP
jgi:putative PIN family toxin of toxin-antitoxin system